MSDGSADTAPWLGSHDRPKILYIVQLPDYSGAELAQIPILRADCDPMVACPPNSRLQELMKDEGVPTVELPFRSLRHSGGAMESIRSVGRGLLLVRDLRRLLRAHPERRVLYSFQIRPGMVASLATMGLGCRSVWNVTDFLPPAPLRQIVRLLARWRADALIVHSPGLARELVGRSSALRRRVSVVSPGVQLARYPHVAASPGAPRAAIVGHVSPTKCTDFAVEVTRLVRQERPDFELHVLGRAQFREDDRRFERELQEAVAADPALAGAVHFHGYVNDVPGVLATMGLLLHCRDDEPFGMVVTEGMAAGLPPVAPAAAGPAEIIEHGRTGLLYRVGDPADAAAQVLTLLEDGALATRIGAEARAEVKRCFSSTRQANEVDRLLARLTGTW